MSSTAAITGEIHGATTGPARGREYLAYIDGFRAVAIVIVVLPHCYDLAFARRPLGDATHVIINLMSGSTALFVFISGLLFHHVNKGRFEFPRFLATKLKSVFLPSVPWILLWAAMALALRPGEIWSTLEIAEPSTWPARVSGAISYALSWSPLWYMPFIAILFAFAPLLDWFSRLGTPARIGWLAAALALGMAVNRPPDNIDKLQDAVYFLFYFLMGIAASVHRERFNAVCRDWRVIAGATVFMGGAAVWQHVYGLPGHHMAPPFEYHGLNVHYLQKIAQIVLVMGLFVRWPGLVGKRTQHVAKASFGIFFAHGCWVLLLEHSPLYGLVMPFDALSLAILGGFVFMLSLATVDLAHRRLGRHARYLVGS